MARARSASNAIALPSAGNAGSAAAAYAAAAGLRCRIAVPEDTPEAFVIEQRAFGAEVRLVPGTISDAGRALQPWAPAPEWWNVSTFKEPFRLEGKKTLGYEIAEQCGWRLPDVILYPTGGGTGLVGMCAGVCRVDRAGLDRPADAAPDRGAGERLRADRACVRSRRQVGRGRGRTRRPSRADCAFPRRSRTR